MGGGRAPCCDKSKVKKGPWSPAEDARLVTFIQKHGHGNWRSLPKQAGLLRCGKSCRLRWINYLRPDVKRGNFTPQEEEAIIKLHSVLGNKWAKIASHLPGRTDNEIKNVWNTHLKKRSNLTNNASVDKNETMIGDSLSAVSSPSSSATSNVSNGDQSIRTIDHHEEGHHQACMHHQHQGRPILMDIEESIGKEPSSPSSTISSSYAPSKKQETGSLLPNRTGQLVQDDDQKVVIADDHDQLNVLEFPLDSDVEFWNMLDNLDCSPPGCYDHFSTTDHGVDGSQSQSSNNINTFGKQEEKEIRGVECSKWLKYFENELGLVGTSATAAEVQIVNQAAANDIDELLV